jgi:hypothetical protein
MIASRKLGSGSNRITPTLEHRAIEQCDRVEAKRLEIARRVFTGGEAED